MKEDPSTAINLLDHVLARVLNARSDQHPIQLVLGAVGVACIDDLLLLTRAQLEKVEFLDPADGTRKKLALAHANRLFALIEWIAFKMIHEDDEFLALTREGLALYCRTRNSPHDYNAPASASNPTAPAPVPTAPVRSSAADAFRKGIKLS